MRILHINTALTGGAAMGVMSQFEEMKKHGVECRLLVAEKTKIHDDTIFVAERDWTFWYSNPLFGKIKHLLMRMPWYIDAEKFDIELREINNNLPEKLYLHHPLSHYTNIVRHPLIDWADIIHLHWVSGFVDYPSFFNKVKKPIVWTLRDMYPAIGAMHFISENTPIPESLMNTELKYRKIKRKAVMHCYGNLHTVAISKQMQDCIKKSEVLHDFPITVICNGIDVNVFHPIHKKEKQDSYVRFLFSSYDIWDRRKGLDRVISALEQLPLPQKELIVIGGNSLNKKIRASFPTTEMGMVSDKKELVKLYSEADFFINASYEEGFAKTPLEAMACGTPVISTPCSGAEDLIRPFNGVVCKGFDSDAITSGISEALSKEYNSEVIRQNIVDNYNLQKIVDQFITLYESILA